MNQVRKRGMVVKGIQFMSPLSQMCGPAWADGIGCVSAIILFALLSVGCSKNTVHGYSSRAEWVEANQAKLKQMREEREAAEKEKGESISHPLPETHRVHGGEYGTCLLEKNGSVRCWGSISDDEPEPEGAKFVELSIGRNHVCGLTPDGGIECWGEMEFLQASSPSGRRFKQVDIGTRHSCGLNLDGKVECWGTELADARDALRSVHKARYRYRYRHYDKGEKSESFERDGFVEIAVGRRFNCGRKEGGKVVCWGADDIGQLEVPEEVEFQRIDARASTACGLDADGVIHCWGEFPGRLTIDNGRGFTNLSMGTGHVCGLHQDGGVTCRVLNESARQAPLTAPSAADFVSIGSGWGHVCGVTEDEAIQCWGNDGNGQARPPSRAPFVEVDVSERHACALTEEGRIHCWGNSQFGKTTQPAGKGFQAVSVGFDHSCALDREGSIHCWGLDNANAHILTENYRRCWMEDRRSNCDQANPPAGDGYRAVFSEGNRSCALEADGRLECWGMDFARREDDVPVPSESRFVDVDLGIAIACGVTRQGALECWGSGREMNVHGRDGSERRWQPPAGNDFESVSVGNALVCGVTDSGKARCKQTNGQEPPSILKKHRFQSVEIVGQHVCGMLDSDQLRCWRRIPFEEKTIDEIPDFEPEESAPSEWTYRSFGIAPEEACAIRQNGSLHCWGAGVGIGGSPIWERDEGVD